MQLHSSIDTAQYYTNTWRVVALRVRCAPWVCYAGTVIVTSVRRPAGPIALDTFFFSLTSSLEIRMSCPGRTKTAGLETLKIFRDRLDCFLKKFKILQSPREK